MKGLECDEVEDTDFEMSQQYAQSIAVVALGANVVIFEDLRRGKCQAGFGL